MRNEQFPAGIQVRLAPRIEGDDGHVGSGEMALVYRQPQIYGLTERRVAYARRTERNRVGRVKGDRIGSVKATLPEHQYRPDYNRD